MRSINHFVIRNGKLVSKIEAQKLPEVTQTKLNILKPATVIVKPISSQSQGKRDDQTLTRIKTYYQGLISRYQDRIKHLQRQLLQKNQLIQKLNKQKTMDIQILSTARDSRLSANSRIQSLTDLKIKLFQTLPVKNNQKEDVLQTGLNQLKKPQQDNYGKITQNLLSIQDHLIKDSSSVSSVSSINQILQQQTQSRNQSDSKKSFDTSTLMARLNKSASLVRNIKKFLQPQVKNTNIIKIFKSPQTQSLQKNVEEQVASVKNQSIQDQFESKILEQELEVQIELHKFIDQLIIKHEQILSLMHELTLQKDQQIKQIRNFYEQIITKIQSQNAKCKECQFNTLKNRKTEDRLVLKSRLDSKQNRKSDQILQKISQKQKYFKQYVSSNPHFIAVVSKQRVPLQVFRGRSKFEENSLQNQLQNPIFQDNDKQSSQGQLSSSQVEQSQQFF